MQSVGSTRTRGEPGQRRGPRGRDRRYREREDRSRRIAARFFGALALLSGLLYLAILIPGLNPEADVVAGAFLAAEVVCLCVFLLAAVNVWSMRFKPREGLSAPSALSVDVFVPVCGEPPDVVDRALASAAALTWPGGVEVHVLDDGGSPEVRAHAERLGLHYMSRVTSGYRRENAKAGNLNFGLDRTTGDLIFVLDPDHVVREDALLRMAGYLALAKVGFVQSKQSFVVPRGDPFNSLDPVFYDAVQLAFDADGTVISCGSGVLYRREALEDIGGFAEWNLAEDLATSYELQAAGWKSLYYPYPVTLGLSPGTIREVYRQRYQWTVDTMRIFFWDNPLLKKGLSWRKRLNHLTIGASYLWAGFFMPVFFLVPLWTYLTARPLLVSGEVAIVLSRVVYFFLFAIAAELLFRGRAPGKQFQFLVGLFPVYVAGTVRALMSPPGRKPDYQPDNVATREPRSRWIYLLPQLCLLCANALLPFYALHADRISPSVLAANILVSAFSLWSLWPIVSSGLVHRAPALARREA